MSKQSEANPVNKMFSNARTIYQPFIDAANAWTGEVQKMQQNAIEEIGRAIDTSHRLAKDSLETFSKLSANMQKQLSEQVARNVEMIDATLKV
ncbi:MAG: hypothetical protein KC503_22340 [Myxococcales bacterium]|nr:hypothetical protein [Myxococcales bacterium]